MNEKNADQITYPVTITPREKEILDLLLKGSIPKEIAYALNISYATVLDHQKNIYRKLEVNKINDLFIKYSQANSVLKYKHVKQENNILPEGKEIKAAFLQWGIVKDDNDTNIYFASNTENINGKDTETFTIHGKVSDKDYSYAGAAAFPDNSTLEAMKNAKCFSFKVLGDGNSYEAILSTVKGGINAVYNFYGKKFTAEKNVISAFNFNIDELSPSTFFGESEPFNRSNIEVLYFHSFTKGDFNLKIWDICFYL